MATAGSGSARFISDARSLFTPSGHGSFSAVGQAVGQPRILSALLAAYDTQAVRHAAIGPPPLLAALDMQPALIATVGLPALQAACDTTFILEAGE